MELTNLYEKLFSHYGDLGWWPAETVYEVIVGAVLTQNTSWANVEKAISNFGQTLTPSFVASVDILALTEIIRPAGLSSQKAVCLKLVTEWFSQYEYSAEAVLHEPLQKARRELISIKGIGNETADSILLYAFGFSTFVIDSYTMRLRSRYPIACQATYMALKAHFESNLPSDALLYNRFHSLIVENAKLHCKKTKPVCPTCPLSSICKKLV
ncbi:MAG: endonuclease [Eubacteriaceae bacterium]|nr:endonuclease [Eubacteriaceae bacterium]